MVRPPFVLTSCPRESFFRALALGFLSPAGLIDEHFIFGKRSKIDLRRVSPPSTTAPLLRQRRDPGLFFDPAASRTKSARLGCRPHVCPSAALRRPSPPTARPPDLFFNSSTLRAAVALYSRRSRMCPPVALSRPSRPRSDQGPASPYLHPVRLHMSTGLAPRRT